MRRKDALNRPGKSGDSVPWEGWSHVREYVEEVPGRSFDDLEIATAEWVDRFNHHRPFEYCDDLTPVEAEQAHYAHHRAQQQPELSNQ